MKNGISVAQAIATVLADSKEVKRLSCIGTAIARSAQASEAVVRLTALSRSPEVKRLSDIGASVARSAHASRAAAAAARIDDAYRSSIASALKASAELRMRTQIPSLGPSSIFDESAIEFREVIRRELGEVNTPDLSDNIHQRDGAVVRADLNAELITFPRATYPQVLVSAGFRLSFASAPVPQAIEEPDAGAAFNPRNWQLLNELEQRLRQVVEQHLKKLSGSNWTRQRVPQSVHQRWLDRQEEDRANGRPVYAVIHYADFMDLADLITRGDNWREAFQAIFRDPNDIAVSLHRLHPVRKALAHSRPLGRADVLTLFSEATRILRTLGMRVLH